MRTIPVTIKREELKHRIDSEEDFVLVEVLSRKEFMRSHMGEEASRSEGTRVDAYR